MKGDFPDDTFTRTDVERCLDSAGLRFRGGSRYILSQCPLHDDRNPSVQIYIDDWFVNCHAGCGRFHITKAFPELRDGRGQTSANMHGARVQPRVKPMSEKKYITVDEMAYWESLPTIPREHKFKNIPLDVLDEMGWRWVETKNSYYIPYFNMTRTQIPFSQLRHLSGDRRFTFLKDARPIAYGLWNLDGNPKVFLVEGASDAAVMEYCAVPYVAMPSAASKTLAQGLGRFCKENAVQLVYAGDNDFAGNKIREALDEVTTYRVCQPPKKYKDWGDFYEAEGYEKVNEHCFKELFPQQDLFAEKTDLEKIQEVFPDAQPLKIVGSDESKEQSPGEPTVLF